MTCTSNNNNTAGGQSTRQKTATRIYSCCCKKHLQEEINNNPHKNPALQGIYRTNASKELTLRYWGFTGTKKMIFGRTEDRINKNLKKRRAQSDN